MCVKKSSACLDTKSTVGEIKMHPCKDGSSGRRNGFFFMVSLLQTAFRSRPFTLTLQLVEVDGSCRVLPADASWRQPGMQLRERMHEARASARDSLRASPNSLGSGACASASPRCQRSQGAGHELHDTRPQRHDGGDPQRALGLGVV